MFFLLLFKSVNSAFISFGFYIPNAFVKTGTPAAVQDSGVP